MEELAADIAAVSRIDAVPTILDVVCRTTGLGFAAVARVTEDRWVACAVKDDVAFGMQPGDEMPIATTFCRDVRNSLTPVIIDHVATDPVFHNHPVPARYGFQSYISVPITREDGRFFGTLCALDPRPARLAEPGVTGMFKLFAQLIAFHLDALEKVSESERRVQDAQEQAMLQEQFIAVLGHDLRNPLAAIEAGARLLGKADLEDRFREILDLQRNAARRMSALIEDVMDLARGRLGPGIDVDRTRGDALADTVAQVIAELRTGTPGRTIMADIDLAAPVRVDARRIGQLVSNLAGNAFAYGAPDTPVRVRARSGGGALEIEVENSGPAIPPEAIARLFQPFFRGGAHQAHRGLGLGLYIAAEIAKAHGGTLDVRSTDTGTLFTLRIPDC